LSDTRNITISHSARRYALGVLVVVYTFNFIDRQILAILLPAIKAEFLVDDWVLGFLAGSAFALFYATLGIPIATLADRWSRRNLIAIAVAIWSAMTALSGMAGNIVHLTLARIGVGVGEAGCSPAAHSLIADYYPPEKRSTAMGIYSLGISLGIMIAYLAGGWVAQNIGWRAAFFMVGLPGLILAVVVRYTMQEPPRGMSEGRIDSGQRPDVLTVTRYLLRRRPDVLTVTRYLLRRKSFVHLAIGSGLASFVSYAVITFFPSFMIRSHGMGLAEIGVYLGLIIGIGSGLGYVGGGYLADKASIVGHKYSLWTVSAAMIFGWLFTFPVYLLNNPYWVFAAFAVPTVFSNFYLATTFAQVQGLVGLRMRAVASALLLFILNIIGLGLGPMFTGILSDLLRASFGDESLRYSLLLVGAVIGPWSAWHFYIAGRHLEADLDRVEE